MFPQQISEQFRSISLCDSTGVMICPEICSDYGTNVAESKAAVLLLSSCNGIPNEWGSVKVTAHPNHADQKCHRELAAKFLQESSVSGLKCSPLFRKQMQVSGIICSQVENHRFRRCKRKQSCSFPVFRLIMIESSRFIDQWQQVGFIFAGFLWKAAVNAKPTVRENMCIGMQQFCSLDSITFCSVFRCNGKGILWAGSINAVSAGDGIANKGEVMRSRWQWGTRSAVTGESRNTKNTIVWFRQFANLNLLGRF